MEPTYKTPLWSDLDADSGLRQMRFYLPKDVVQKALAAKITKLKEEAAAIEAEMATILGPSSVPRRPDVPLVQRFAAEFSGSRVPPDVAYWSRSDIRDGVLREIEICEWIHRNLPYLQGDVAATPQDLFFLGL